VTDDRNAYFKFCFIISNLSCLGILVRQNSFYSIGQGSQRTRKGEVHAIAESKALEEKGKISSRLMVVSMKSYWVTCFLLFFSTAGQAQIGRNELPNDTIPIGGEIQKNKMEQAKAQEELRVQLISIRDSVSSKSSDKISNGKTNLPALKKELDEVIRALKTSENNEALMKKGYTLLQEARNELKAPPRDSN
jgi:hypothetical protein